MNSLILFSKSIQEVFFLVEKKSKEKLKQKNINSKIFPDDKIIFLQIKDL